MQLIQIYIFAITFLVNTSVYSQSKPAVAFEENQLYGYKDRSGKVVIKPEFQMAFDFTPAFVAFAYKENKWVCIDPNNNVLLEVFPYDNGPDDFSEKLARFIENKKTGFFDPNCKKVIPANYDHAMPFVNGFAKVCNGCYSEKDGEHSTIVGGKYGLIDRKGKLTLNVEYDAIQTIDFKKKEATVTKNSTRMKIKLK